MTTGNFPPTDTAWTDYLEKAGAAPRPTLAGSPAWQDMKQVVRHNDRIYSQLVEEKLGKDTDAGVLAARMSREFCLFFQSHMTADRQLNSPRLSVDALAGDQGGGSTTTAGLDRSGTTVTVSLPEHSWIETRSMLVTNRSAAIAYGIHFSQPGRDFSSLDSIIRTLVGQDSDPAKLTQRDLAYRLLFGFRRRIKHSPKNTEKNSDSHARNPVSLFNYLGGSTCGVLSVNFAILCGHVGLKARVQRLACHTTTEVLVDDRWIIMDPDPESIPLYPDPARPERLLGLEDILERGPGALENLSLVHGNDDIQANQSTMVRNRERKVAFLSSEKRRLVAESDALLEEIDRTGSSIMSMRLFPGERAFFMYEAEGPWIAASMPLSLPPENRSLLVREFEILDAEDLDHLETTGIRMETEIGSRHLLVDDDSSGRMVIPIDNAYPVLDVKLSISGVGLDVSKAGIGVQLGGDETARLRPLRASTSGCIQYSLRRALLSPKANEQIQVHLEIPESSRIDSIQVCSLCHVHVTGLPKLTAGETRIACGRQDSSKDFDVIFNYETRPLPGSGSAINAVSPKDDSQVRIDDIGQFEWAFDEESQPPAGQCRFLVSVAHDMEMTRVVFGRLHMATGDNFLAIDDEVRERLEEGRTYYWRVQIVDDRMDPLSPWSRTFKFKTT